MRNRKFNLSIRVRAALIVSITLVAVATVITVTMISQIQAQVMGLQQSVARTSAKSLARSASLPLAVGDHQELRRMLDQHVWNESFQFMVIYDEHKNVVASNVIDEPAWERYSLAFNSVDNSLVVWEPIDDLSQGFESDVHLLDDLDVGVDTSTAHAQTTPEHAGTVVVSLSLDQAFATLRARSRTAILYAATTFLVVLPFVWFGATAITRRLKTLLKASEQIASGNLSFPIEDSRNDELGRLANNETLQEQISARTKDLEAAKIAAEQASEAKSAFLANMSHEIRTPINAIIGFCAMLSDPDLSLDEARVHNDTIRRNSEHLLAIVNDILDISKIEAGELLLENTKTDPLVIIQQVVEGLQSLAHKNNITLETRLTSPVPKTVELDVTRLRQILFNLTNNAIKFTHTGGVILDVSYNEPENTLGIDVTDTGIGIAPDVLEQLFRPFTQADETMTRRFGGTGLGLAISKQLAIKMNGDITVESTPGVGSTFTAILDAGRCDFSSCHEPGTLTSAEKTKPSAPKPNTVGRAVSILLVEDGPDNQRLINAFLKKANCSIDAAQNGKEGLDAALERWHANDPYDIILMDMQMPIMDGYTATQTLREQGYPGWIVALTAHAMSQDKNRCLDAGCDVYMSKPVDRKKLIELVTRLAASQRSEDTPGAQAA
ncbi:MAG: ATP-binding protein [Planctomycetota bacterium]|jgi:signal transduction histidine kinase/ActR/RegA family two-component response regulator